jgi:NADH dehydrogenase FAD-containing subunit
MTRDVSVAVLGGGYAGIAVAKALDQSANVTLVEPRESFFHTIAALRGLVQPEWLTRILLPYDRLLERGRVVRASAVHVDGTTVVLSSGAELRADFVVLATGARYPYPAKADREGDADVVARYTATHHALAAASGVLILGAGSVGIELAGEISTTWPEKRVTILDPLGELLGGRYEPGLASELRRQLTDRGVELLLGTSLVEGLPTPPGELGAFTVATDAGTTVDADIWFRCFGVDPISDYLAGDLRSSVQLDGSIDVTDELRVPGHETTFALGDVSTAAVWKQAGPAQLQAQVVAANIRALIAGESALEKYLATRPHITIPLGQDGGAALRAGGVILGAEETADAKSRAMHVGHYAGVLGVAEVLT